MDYKWVVVLDAENAKCLVIPLHKFRGGEDDDYSEEEIEAYIQDTLELTNYQWQIVADIVYEK